MICEISVQNSEGLNSATFMPKCVQKIQSWYRLLPFVTFCWKQKKEEKQADVKKSWWNLVCKLLKNCSKDQLGVLASFHLFNITLAFCCTCISREKGIAKHDKKEENEEHAFWNRNKKRVRQIMYWSKSLRQWSAYFSCFLHKDKCVYKSERRGWSARVRWKNEMKKLRWKSEKERWVNI